MDNIPLIKKHDNSHNMHIDTVRKISIASICVSIFLIGIIGGYIVGFYTTVSFNSNSGGEKRIGYHSWFCHYGACYKEVLMQPSNYSHSKYVCEKLMNSKLPTRYDTIVMGLFSPIKNLENIWLTAEDGNDGIVNCSSVSYTQSSYYHNVTTIPCNSKIATVCMVKPIYNID
ncbi:hypothetical protein [Mudlarkpox virus]|nr:hypothetical protein ChPV001 [Cheloniid poxvirus 1]QRI43047.1 hypothetical protein ChPV329 [Cheloniid poxvirus 1]QRM15281.1 hypothetical protein [Mudlarkpox virus]QRM15606.1 hypothetical protein [Mudlarkpox virus]